MTQTENYCVPPFTIALSPGIILLLGAIYFFCAPGTVTAYLIAILPHELGHIIALRMFGLYPTRLNVRAGGCSLDYCGDTGLAGGLVSALAGPVLGLIFSFCLSLAGNQLKSEYLCFCAGLGFLLNCFNLLPILPLDGWRAVKLIMERLLPFPAARRCLFMVSVITGAIVFGLGCYIFAKSGSVWCLSAGIWATCLVLMQKSRPCK